MHSGGVEPRPRMDSGGAVHQETNVLVTSGLVTAGLVVEGTKSPFCEVWIIFKIPEH